MKKYNTPQIILVELSGSDVLTASNGTPLLPYNWFDEDSEEEKIL